MPRCFALSCAALFLALMIACPGPGPVSSVSPSPPRVEVVPDTTLPLALELYSPIQRVETTHFVDGDVAPRSLFARGEGLDTFWSVHREEPRGFQQIYARLDASGQLLGKPVGFGQNLRSIVRGDGRYGGTNIASLEGGRGAFEIFEPRGGELVSVARTSLPLAGNRHGNAHAAWNPVDRQWGVVWTEDHDDPRTGQFIESRLFFGRMGASGDWISGSEVALTMPEERFAHLSAYPGALAWTGRAFAVAWLSTDSNREATNYLTELSPTFDPRHIELAQVDRLGSSSPGTLATNGEGLVVVAWGSSDHSSKRMHLRVTTVFNAERGKIVVLGAAGPSSYFGALAFDGRRFGVAWTEFADDRSSRVCFTQIEPGPSVAEPRQFQLTSGSAGAPVFVLQLVHDGARFIAITSRHEDPMRGHLLFLPAP